MAICETPPVCGAQVDAEGTSFRVWAPRAQRVEVLFNESNRLPLGMTRDERGFFSARSAQAPAGTRYQYRLDGGQALPDPYSRFQPEGVHGPSVVIDPGLYSWNDAQWRGLDPARQVFYELHVGAFTADGTYAAAAERLPLLRDLGITCIELMPVAAFAGERGWGYDGVSMFAPYRPYGTPDELRAFVDRAHGLGIGVILDVVYNHVGAEGNYLPLFSDEYFTDRHANDWGEALNYYCEPVRDFCVDNAVYWVREFHFDGLRLDAIQSIHDPSHPALLARLSQATRAAAHPRVIVLAAEDYLQRADLLKPIEAGGAQLDYLWNDDFHHAARVAVTGNRRGYFSKYQGSAQELLSTLRRGFLFQGQYDAWKKARRGHPTRGIERHQFIAFTQNHDQIANTLYGARLPELTSATRGRAILAALLLGPQTPLLFMGEEFGARTPFGYFADYAAPVDRTLWAGRRRELAASEQFAGEAAQSRIPDPSVAKTFLDSKLDWDTRGRDAVTWRLYAALLALRRDDAVLAQRPEVATDGAVLADQAFVFRWFEPTLGDRLLVVNLGAELSRGSIAEPLLAPPQGWQWQLCWSSDAPESGGLGVVTPETEEGWFIGAESACFLRAHPRGPP